MMEHRLHATLHLTCDVCGQPAMLVVGGVGGQWVFHDGCASPTVTIPTPRVVRTVRDEDAAIPDGLPPEAT